MVNAMAMVLLVLRLANRMYIVRNSAATSEEDWECSFCNQNFRNKTSRKFAPHDSRETIQLRPPMSPELIFTYPFLIRFLLGSTDQLLCAEPLRSLRKLLSLP